MESKQSPIFSKSSDFLTWLLNHTDKYPKNERFRMAKRMEDAAFSLHENLIRAARAKRSLSAALNAADFDLECLRFYVRICQQRKLMTMDQYEFIVKSLSEIGRLLGGWMGKLGKENPE
jgi:four helix bundle protein